MKNLFLLPFIAFLIFSCNNEEKIVIEREIKFSISEPTANGSTGGRTTALPNPTTLLVSIKDASGTIVADRRELTLYKFGETFLSAPITLKTSEGASYALTEFFVLDANHEIAYVTPREGSEMAHLVADALNIQFAVSKDVITTVTPEVLSLNENADPQKYGYGQFGFKIVKTISTVFSSFIKGLDNFKLTESHLKIEGLSSLTSASALWSYEVDLRAEANTITFKEAAAYRVTVTKEGYQTWNKVSSLKNGERIEILFDEKATILWNKHYGGNWTEYLISVLSTPNGGAVLFVNSNSNSDDATGAKRSTGLPDEDIWIVKLSATGDIVWKKRYGGSEIDRVTSAVALPDGSGYMLTGYTVSKDGDFVGKVTDQSNGNGFMMKIGTSGELLSIVMLDQLFEDIEVAHTGTNNFIIVSTEERHFGKRYNFEVRQVDQNGNTIWKKIIWPNGAQTTGNGKCISKITDGYILYGTNRFAKISTSGDVINSIDVPITITTNLFGRHLTYLETATGYLFSGYDQSTHLNVLFNYDKVGNLKWNKELTTSENTSAVCIINGSNGNYLAVGRQSVDKSPYSYATLFEINGTGNITRLKKFGGTGRFGVNKSFSEFRAIIPVSSGEFHLIGRSTDTGNDVPGNYSTQHSTYWQPFDIWAMKVSF